MDRQVSDDEVADALIQRYTADNPSRGERMIIGMVRTTTNALQQQNNNKSITIFYTEG